MKLRKFTMYAEDNADENMDEDEDFQKAVEEAQRNPTNAQASAKLMEAERKRKKKMLEEAGSF